MIKKGIFAASWWLSSLLVSLLALLQACSGSGTPSYPLGGAVSGLSGAGLVLANGADTVQYHRTERGQGYFYRRFVLPNTVDGERVKASGKNGILNITVPKQAKAQPRRIQIAA